MKRLMSALLAAGMLCAPMAIAHAQDAGASKAGQATSADGGAPSEQAAEKGQAEIPHYPLKEPEQLNWSFAGPFGRWDIEQLQRGLNVYKNVCSACHSLNLVAFRNLKALGYSDDQVKAFAAQYTIKDGPNGDGEMFDRPGIPSDYFPAPFANPEAAAAANGGAAPPDLSLMAKARAAERGFPRFIFDIFTQYAQGGPDYIHALLTGFGHEPPPGLKIADGTYYNPYFMNGPALKMPPPLSDGVVSYPDGAPETVDQYARDVAAFLMWAAEPHLVERKATGFVTMIFLIVFAGLLYVIKKRVWADTPH
ncbi:cytochrome c1 [Jiella sp. M17.18]|uniref:cytochrome c1 n=1 Tax=Jiella sp. M17.18 TaxID=3234247 RepID=UPI0034DE333C